jgi:hypothetical protein
MARHDGKGALHFAQRGVRIFWIVQPKTRFLLGYIGAMAFKTFIRKNGPDIRIIAYHIRQSLLSFISALIARNPAADARNKEYDE